MKFPVLIGYQYKKSLYLTCPRFIDGEKLDKDHAMKIHSQTIERLKERGGLSPKEIMLNLKKGGFDDIYNYSVEDSIKMVQSIGYKE